MEVHVISADEGVKILSNAQSPDVSGDSSCQSELTITNEMLSSRPVLGDANLCSVLSPKPVDQSAVSAGRTGDTVESCTSGLSSQENTVTRTRSRDVMDFEHFKERLSQLSGASKEAAGPSTAAAKTKPEAEEVKDMSNDTGGSVQITAPNNESQVGVGRPVTTSQQVVAGNQVLDMQSVSQRGPSVSPEPSSVPAQPASQQASLHELPAMTVTQRDTSIQPAVPAAAVGQVKTMPSNGEHAAGTVQPVKPVPLYPVTMGHPLPQQKMAVGPVGQVNGNIAVPHMSTGVNSPNVQAAMLRQHYQMPAVGESSAGFVSVQPGVVADMVGTGTPASPDGINQVLGAQQPIAADYSQASLLALYNQMMMPLPMMAPAWSALGLNPFLVAANPLLAAQMMYGSPLLPPMSDPMGHISASDPHLGVQSCPVPGQEHLQPGMPAGLGLDHLQRDQAVRPVTGLAPLSSVPPGSIQLTSIMLPGAAATRPLSPRLSAAVSGHEHHPAIYAASMQRKKPDRPPQLAELEQALINKLHGPRKPVAPMVAPQAVHSPAAHSLPGTMAWFPMPYGQHIQPAHTPTAAQSPVVSPLFNTELQLPGSASGLAADIAPPVSAIPGMALTAPATHSGRTTPSLFPATESVPLMVKSVTAVTLPSTQKPTSESAEAVHAATSAAEKLTATSASSTGLHPSKRKLQFTVSAVKDDPLVVNNVQESTSVCEASTVTSESVLQNPPENSASVQTSASVPSGLHEPSAVSTGNTLVKKGRFRISDVKDDADVTSGQQENSSLPQETVLMSGTRTDPSNNSTTTAALAVPELCAQQVSSNMLLAFRFCCHLTSIFLSVTIT